MRGDDASGMDIRVREVVRGSKPGCSYIRYSRNPGFKSLGEDRFLAQPDILEPTSAGGKLLEWLRRVVIGRRLATDQAIHERLTKVKGLAVLSSDALSSVAYI